MTRRTTITNYDTDLEAARALFDERTGFGFTVHETEEDAQVQKTIDDALNNEWKRDITIGRWVDLVMEATNQRPRHAQPAKEQRRG